MGGLDKNLSTPFLERGRPGGVGDAAGRGKNVLSTSPLPLCAALGPRFFNMPASYPRRAVESIINTTSTASLKIL